MKTFDFNNPERWNFEGAVYLYNGSEETMDFADELMRDMQNGTVLMETLLSSSTTKPPSNVRLLIHVSPRRRRAIIVAHTSTTAHCTRVTPGKLPSSETSARRTS